MVVKVMAERLPPREELTQEDGDPLNIVGGYRYLSLYGGDQPIHGKSAHKTETEPLQG